MQPETLPVFIGFDKREADACNVTRASLLKHATIPLYVRFLDQANLRAAGLYDRGVDIIDGVPHDSFDRKPFSTEFAFSRFIVPALCLYDGWALFVDGDFLFRADIAELFALRNDRYAVMVVQHEHRPTMAKKMDGMPQPVYYRKNWSSLVLWNCSHPANRSVNIEWVNRMPGLFLHSFNWLTENQIGALPPTWNHLVGYSKSKSPKAAHFTEGVPSMTGYANVEFADEWRCYAG